MPGQTLLCVVELARITHGLMKRNISELHKFLVSLITLLIPKCTVILPSIAISARFSSRTGNLKHAERPLVSNIRAVEMASGYSRDKGAFDGAGKVIAFVVPLVSILVTMFALAPEGASS